MERGQTQHDHREYEDLLAAAALGVLSSEEHALLQRHIRACQSCRSTFGALVTVADALPMQVEERSPSPALRDRLRAQIQPEAAPPGSVHGNPQSAPIPLDRGRHDSADQHGTIHALPASRSTINWAVWGALAAAMLVLAVLSGIVVDRFLLQADDAEPETIALQYPGEVQSLQGTLEYLPEQDVLHFHAPDLPDPPQDHVYQAWLIDDAGPRPIGVIDPQTNTFVTTVDRERDDVFAITVEPAPLGSAGPTTDPVIVATLDGEA